MDNIKRVLTVLAGVLLISSMVPQNAEAQWGIGASYEVRDEEPQNGFGVRIERGILNKLPIVQLGLRAHFSNFSEENQVDYQNRTGSFSQEIKDYDFGLTALGGVSVGFLKPYVGVGLGSNTVDMDVPDDASVEAVEESSLYWNALVGAEVSAIPLLKPFVEYRYTNVNKDFFQDARDLNVPAPSSSNGRIVFGVLLKF
ncbi:outer membrane beta-barrel protein [Halalkalibaculum sp. DA3122]|uniref:outer membrane beta-barrel protein n=1 Tax=Halalkalibaculum sp. DA3122 TaxID=3373607 RepID=UPI0037541CA8